MIKVAFVMRVDAHAKPGGDVVQINKYIEWGKKLNTFDGVIITNLTDDLSNFHIVHLTNIDRPVEAIWFFYRARYAGKPIFLSSIHHSYSEIIKYEISARIGIFGLISKRLNFQNLEIIRSFARAIKFPSLFFPTLISFFLGVKSQQKKIILNSKFNLILTEKEKNDLITDFDLPPTLSNFEIIRNGVDFKHSTPISNYRDIDICIVGRIEARKNQLLILRALNDLGLRAKFIGAQNSNHKIYHKKFIAELSQGGSEYLGALAIDDVYKHLSRSKVHISASWFEVSSLVDLEASISGCVVVSSICGGTYELLGDTAYYVNPSNLEDIKSKIQLALNFSNSRQNVSSTTIQSITWKDSINKLSKIYLSNI